MEFQYIILAMTYGCNVMVNSHSINYEKKITRFKLEYRKAYILLFFCPFFKEYAFKNCCWNTYCILLI